MRSRNIITATVIYKKGHISTMYSYAFFMKNNTNINITCNEKYDLPKQ